MSIPGVNGSVVSSYQATQYKKYKSKKKWKDKDLSKLF
jgi:hypothetical protein